VSLVPFPRALCSCCAHLPLPARHLLTPHQTQPQLFLLRKPDETTVFVGRETAEAKAESRWLLLLLLLFLGFIVELRGKEMDTGKRSMSITQTGAGRKASVASGAGGDGSADAALAKMGYASELPRNLSMLSVLGL
jgi:hypothetical protein